MNIITKKENETLSVLLEGRLDTTTSSQLETEITSSVTPDIQNLIFDFSTLEYMSSAGIRVVMSTEEMMSEKKGMKLINVNDEIMETFEMTGLVDILTIE